MMDQSGCSCRSNALRRYFGHRGRRIIDIERVLGPKARDVYVDKDDRLKGGEEDV